MISPAYPVEMREFTRGLDEVGAKVIGVGDTPRAGLPPEVKQHLTTYFQAPSLWDSNALTELARSIARKIHLDRVECLWEPGMILAAQLREALGLPGMTVEQTLPFRDKEIMKQVLDRKGIRTPKHARIRTAKEARQAAETIGYPVILKPIAGAGATHTYRVDDDRELERAITRLRHVEEVSLEEFVEGEEFTFDTICADGEVLYHNMSWYRPRPLDGKLNEWISPQAIALRDVDDPKLSQGQAMGFEVLQALGFENGFTHMEWYLKDDGEVVFGEIGARPPGARAVDLMNYASDVDLYRGWAEAVLTGRFNQTIDRRYNSAIIFKRAKGRGTIQKIEGLTSFLRRYGEHVVVVDILPVGSRRRDWQQMQISDGFVLLRHPSLRATMAMADAVGTQITLYAGD